MAHAPLHPSQRRVACELCRRHKSKCQRVHRNDPKCSRCMILGAECIAGQQKKVGRPKHVACPVRGAPRSPEFNSRPGANAAFRRLETDRHSQQGYLAPTLQGLRQDSECLGYNLAPPPVAVAVTKSCPIPTIWRNPGPEAIQQEQEPLISDIMFDDHEFPVTDLDSRINLSTSDNHSPRLGADHIYPASPILEMEVHERPRSDISATDAIAKLSQINIDLHIRLAAAEKYRAMLDLNTIVYPEGPLFISDYTLAEFVLKSSEDFVQILTRLCTSQTSNPGHNLPRTSSSTFSAKPLPAPLALTITSIFTQLISLYEVLLDHLITRIERLPTDPLTPLRTVKFKAVLRPDKPCAQGMMFANAIVELLEEMECNLGLSEHGKEGRICLLSARQVDVLWSELEDRVGITSTRDGGEGGGGYMRPADVKQLFRKVATVLCEFSLRE
ncbi:hypothetical protein BJY00DRAFT_279225 [Aspergillus carlsbadensis]|nr:hypothetical protein BJY00DRAFT_279225 [Aspergillus carlsbadensis]